MMTHAEDDETFKNTVNHYLSLRLATHSIDEVAELGLTKFGRGKCEHVFLTCWGDGDTREIMCDIPESDEPICYVEKAAMEEKYVNDAIDAEIPRQLLILRSDHDE